MTAFSARSKGLTPRAGNCKDGRQGRSRSRSKAAEFLALGFTQTDWNKFSYTWQGDFPTFIISPGIVGLQAGQVARYDSAEIEILFPYGTPPEEIKARLDDEIAEIVSADGRWVRS